MQKPIPFLAPVRAAIYIALNFRADLANKKGLSSRKGIRKEHSSAVFQKSSGRLLFRRVSRAPYVSSIALVVHSSCYLYFLCYFRSRN